MKENLKLVSVAMASYNGARFIAEQLESLVHQSYNNIEVVIVDDHSTDDTVSVIRAFQAKYPYILLLQNEHNLGVTKTFERAIRHCKGSFIALSDQDDIWDPEKISILVTEIGDHDAVYANSLLVNDKGESLQKWFSGIMNMRSYYTGTSLLLSNSPPGHSLLMRASLATAILPFPEHLFFDLWIGFCAAGNNGIKYVDQILVKYRQHNNNTIGTRDSKNKRIRQPVKKQFESKLLELQVLATAPIKDAETKKILHEMISYFHRRWSFKRSAFFFKYYNEILSSKNKPMYRKKLFCVKMFFKPNF